VRIHGLKKTSKVMQTLFVTVMATPSKTLTVMATSLETLTVIVTLMVIPMVMVMAMTFHWVRCPGRRTLRGSIHQPLLTQRLLTVHLPPMPERCRREK
jgi:hypothetical protein